MSVFNEQYRQRYEEAIKELRQAMEEYKPFLESRERWLTDEEIKASDMLDKAEREWVEARRKYFGEEK